MEAATLRIFAALGAMLALGIAATAAAQEASRGDQPTPDTVEDLGGALQEAFDREEELRPPLFPRNRQLVQKLPPFLRDTELGFNARTYYFDRFRLDGTRSQAWAIGGALEYRSGWLFDRLTIGAALYTSQPIVAPKDRDGTGLLRPGQNGYTVAGKAYAELRFYEQNKLTLYRQEVDLPYVNRADTRMTPNTFQAYLARGSIPDLPAVGKVDYVAGWIQRIRERGANAFVPMSEAAGVKGGNEGLATVTLRMRPRESYYFGLTNHLVPDTFDTLYGEGSWFHDLTDEWQIRLEGQFTYQTTIGEENLSTSPFDTWQVALRAAASWRGAIFTLAGSQTGTQAPLLKPYGLSPSYLSLIISDFDRAGEGALLLGVSYDFARVGLEGLSGFTNFAIGYDARDQRTDDEFADQLELDLTLDYRMHGKWVEGLWFRARYAFNTVEGAGRAEHDIRLIVNYEIPFL